MATDGNFLQLVKREALKKCKNLVFLDHLFVKILKTKFASELSIDVMKHAQNKWGGNISSIHNVMEP